MRICGIDLKSSDAILVIIESTNESFDIIKTDIQKLTLDDTNNAEHVKKFNTELKRFIKDNQIEKIAIKKRQTKGKFAGGAISFKMEGMIQLSPDAEVELLAGTTISKTIKKNPPPAAKLFSYQQTAYETAYTLLQIT